MNISDAAIEELEQLFVPPDITPDMYDGPSENVDYDYLEFLLGCQSDKAGGPGPDEMEVDDDPEKKRKAEVDPTVAEGEPNKKKGKK